MATLVEGKVIVPEQYSKITKQLLEEHASYRSRGYQQAHMDERSLTLFDDLQQRYALIDLGWYEGQYGRRLIIFIEFLKGKVWIHQDTTEDGIANELTDLGIPKSAIVLAYRPPELRAYTGFATE
jgi:XisI protein